MDNKYDYYNFHLLRSIIITVCRYSLRWSLKLEKKIIGVTQYYLCCFSFISILRMNIYLHSYY